jgi:hypothetical protein
MRVKPVAEDELVPSQGAIRSCGVRALHAILRFFISIAHDSICSVEASKAVHPMRIGSASVQCCA